jgi:hypothetical protein
MSYVCTCIGTYVRTYIDAYGCIPIDGSIFLHAEILMPVNAKG